MMKPNILIITIDSLRADRCYDKNKTAKTPNIDKLIQNGIYFSQAISTSDATGTSLGSIFTGKYPFKTGITHFTYNSDILTYFDILKKSGYHVYGIFPDVSFFLKLSPNFDEKSLYVYDKRELWLQLEGGIGQQILEKLESTKMVEPWLYFIHLMDLHAPFFIPKKFDHKEYGQTRYDRMVSSIDFWLGRILQKIDQQKTLLILSSDHGDYIPFLDISLEAIPEIQKMLKKGKEKFPTLEPIGVKLFVTIKSIMKSYRKKKLKKTLTKDQLRTLEPRGRWGLFDELIHVPLILSGFGIKKPKIILEQVRHVDIFPTILEILNLPNFLVNTDGRSLLPLINERKMVEVPAYIETGSRNPKKLGNIIGLRTPHYKYLRQRSDSTQKVNLFDLRSDPLEQNDIATTHLHHTYTTHTLHIHYTYTTDTPH